MPLLLVISYCFVFVFVFLLFSSSSSSSSSVLRLGYDRPLQFSRTNSKFKISIFSDLHYGENAWTDWGPRQDENSDKVMDAVLDTERPDFLVYLGDVITANNFPIPNASLYWSRAVSAATVRGIPFSTVFGNHDDAAFVWPAEWFSSGGVPDVTCPQTAISFEGCSFRGTSRLELMGTEIGYNRLSYSSNGPKELWPSVSNYVLQIASSKSSCTPAMFLYFLDSGGGSYPEIISYAQAKWFAAQAKAINPDESVPEMIFWHIPSTAYRKVAPKPNSKIVTPCVGSINFEPVASQEAEWGIMDVLVNRTSVKAVFAGHNHGLDWCCPYKNLWLCYARHTGYGGYGNWPRGSRIIEVIEHPFSMRSWIRMEDGSELSHVILST